MEIDIVDSFDKWFEKYRPLEPGGRFKSMSTALKLLKERTHSLGPNHSVILETGCLRQRDDWGAGMSTMIFGDFCREYNGSIYSVDINQRNVNLANEITVNMRPHVNLTCMDSVRYITSCFPKDRIDLLYLDSWDYPIIEIADQYGPREDFPETLAMLISKGDEWFLDNHIEEVLPAQEHCLNELFAALPYLTTDSIILIDDINFPGEGKGRLAHLWLESHGWDCVMRTHQSLWVHNTKPFNGA